MSVHKFAQLKKKTPGWIYLTILQGDFERFFPDAKLTTETKEVYRIEVEE